MVPDVAVSAAVTLLPGVTDVELSDSEVVKFGTTVTLSVCM